MSSLFTVAEIELARLGLAAVDGERPRRRRRRAGPRLHGRSRPRGRPRADGDGRRGARARHLLARAAAAPGHRGPDRRPADRSGEGDFFALAREGKGFGVAPALVHAVLLDIDHTPHHVLHPSHADLYTREGLARLAARLHPGGVFALWSDDPPEDAFTALLAEVFADAAAHEVTFANPLTGGTSSNTVYVATHGTARTPARRLSASARDTSARGRPTVRPGHRRRQEVR